MKTDGRYDPNWEEESRSWGYSSSPRCYSGLAKSKDEWAGPSLDRAFSEEVPWTFRRQAQMKFYGVLLDARKRLSKRVKRRAGKVQEWQSDAQLSAFYTSFPWPARVAIGHTIFLDLKNLQSNIASSIKDALSDSAKDKALDVDAGAYASTMAQVADALGDRAVFDALDHTQDLLPIEFYRLFQSCQINLTICRLRDVIYAAILFGDVLPEARTQNWHPMTIQIMESLRRASTRFWEQRVSDATEQGSQFYSNWAQALMDELCKVLPPAKDKEEDAAGSKDEKPGAEPATSDGSQYKYPPPSEDDDLARPPDRVPPMSQAQPPRLEKETPREKTSFLDDLSKSIQQQLLSNVIKQDGQTSPASSSDADEGSAKKSEVEKALDALSDTASMACKQTSTWEDMREDLVEQTLALAPMEAGPIEGAATSGNDVRSNIGGEEVGGELFDRVVDPCEDVRVLTSLTDMARPVTESLRHNLYPSTLSESVALYPRRSGQLDGKRLPLAEFSDVVYRRFESRSQLDPNGRALLLIAADTSASLSTEQMQMCKCLAAAWLDSIAGSQMQVMAGFYHSAYVRKNVMGPVVEWGYHPHKTPTATAREAVRAVAALPQEGSGAQSDALSLTYMLDEARTLSRGSQIYLTLITDCAFNKSFPGNNASPVAEVVGVLDEAREKLDGKLHVTLVALQDSVPDEINEAVDAVVAVDKKEIGNPALVAQKVGTYVAGCIQERRKTMQRT